MNTEILSMDRESSHSKVAKLPWWLLIIGFVPIFGSAILAGRLIWEQTVWTWARGPQMVGFSLIHTSKAVIPLFLSPLLLIAWLLVVAILIVWKLAKKCRISWSIWTTIGISVFILATLLLPYEFWQRLFVSRLARGPYSAIFLVYAAASGDLKTVEAFLSHGVPVNAQTSREGTTGLHAAAAGGNIKTMEYLILKGANINALDRYGDSPLEKAISKKHEEAAKFLAEHGAQRIRGDEALRQKVIEEIVHEDIEKMQRMRK